MKTMNPAGRNRKILFIVFFALFLGGLMAQGKAHAANQIYYVDPAGNDANNGTSISTPWKTLTKVNATTFTSGDKILFKAGSSWTGQLYPKGSGSNGSPILIDQYGSGSKPLINGNGAGATVYLYNQQYWEIQNLEIKNYNGVNSNRRGIEIVSKDIGTLNHIYIKNNNVHDVWGDNTKDTNGSAGILFVSRGTVSSNFNDVWIDNNIVGPDVDRTGIGFASEFWCRSGVGCTSAPNWYASTNVVISNNYVQDIGGDGIVPQETLGAVVQYNTVNGFNMRSGSYNAGIWPWNADNTIIQYNEAYGGHTTLDGTGFDSDFGCTGTIIQYNYSHDNDGGFLLLMGTDVGTDDQVTIRYNISQNDKRGILVFASGNPTNLQIYNNDFYVGRGTGTEIITTAGNAGNHAWGMFNNIIYNLDSGGYSSGVGGRTSDYNLYYGNHPASEPNEAHKMVSDAMFVNPGSGTNGRTTVDGYKLLQGSPAFGSGVLINNNGGKDYWGNAVSSTSAPNRGAYNGAGIAGSLNKVSNPGFESGVLSPWTNWNTASVVSTNSRSGGKALQLSGGPGSAEQVIYLNPNTTYTLTGYAKTSNSSEPVSIGVKNYGGAETAVSLSSTSYTLGTVTFTTGPTNTTATIYVYKPAGANSAWGDDFNVQSAGITINGSVLGRTFDGEGVLSGGGGNTRLLIDYPEPYRSDILDYLFKPNFGAGYTHLKVEVGGDMNSTSGTEPSHARTLAENSAPNMNRGYELWLMSEAKKRNPNIVLSILEWGAPQWIGNMWSQNNADYLVSYIKGAKSVWGLDINYVGGSQNESFNGTSQQARDYIVNILRPTLNNNGLSNVKIIAPDILSSDWAFADGIATDTALKNAVSVIGYHYVNGISTANAQNSGLPIWESEGWTGVGDWNGSYNLAKEMNDNYIKAKLTATNVWHLSNSAYDNLSWPSSGILIANSPWSGNYKVQPAVWAAAHTTQFTKPGWNYLDSGTGITTGNTSYVTMKQPDSSGNYSIIMVTGGAFETMKFNLTGGLSTGTIHVWKSNSTQQFIQQSDITPSGGSFSINIEPNAIYSLTTTTGQQKGVAAHAIPTASAFPNPYSENFESYAVGTTPKYTQDEHGAFEVSNKFGGTGKALRQVITGPLLQWNAWGEPISNSAFTEFGNLSWRDYDYSADVLIENSGTVSIIGRVGTQNRNAPQDNKLKGYKLVVDQSGNWKLVIGAPDTNSENQLASGVVPLSANTWHNLKLSFHDTTIKAYIDSQLVASITDNTFLYGLVGLGSGWNYAQYDNISVITDPLRPNLALGKSVSADSEETSKGNVASNGNDGNTDTRWTANDGNLNHSWKVDLGSGTNMTGTEVLWEHNNVYKYKIEVSNDNLNWTTVSDKTGNTNPNQTQADNFTASGRYVRITVTGLASNEWASFYEFRVFGL
ncbi:hypothetical protein GCM10008018_12930 [Paenibacillus marchantiophytorum]|uniref:galactosylceramidase n=1 Tax=Paenibacillus marchantiophytorum TaxID=1619310 RepID=A0ABQ2BSF5_9BACL|nr:discoidin domain-containing protein [Paenibacillus marchantiophytorum]GGI45591.1 hypothetical protein GCM10008018_12930 [Paenibacillus marchantiophytorum]